jgi:tetratricopeptide (TPR) repeat protein
VIAIFAATALVVAGCRLGTGGAIAREIAASRQLAQSGRIAIERGDLTSAESLLAQAIKSHPDDPDARRSYADVLWRRGAHEEALLQAQEALRLAEDDPTIAVQLGEMWLSLGRLDQARTLADQAIDTDPRAAAAWGLRARVKLRDGQHEAALADLHRALEFSPHDQKLLLEAAEVYRVLGRPNRALSVLAALRETYPGGEAPAHVFHLEGLAFAALGRHGEAIDAYVAAVERDLTNAENLSRLADAQLQAGQVAAAEEAARKALAVDPNHRLAREVWSRVEGLRTANLPRQPSPWQRPESSAASSQSVQPLR